VSEENNIQELMRQGIEAAREGNKAEARKFFEQVTEQDDQNEKAWMWLASVMETDEERRVCLQQVVRINPLNERAQEGLKKLELRGGGQPAEDEVIPGVSRRTLTLVGGGAAGLILVLIIIVLAISGSRGAQTAAETQVALDSANTQAAQSQAFANATETQLALNTPTFTPTETSVRATLPPEFTPTLPATAIATLTPLPPISGASGRIAGWSGRDIARTGFLSLVIFPLDPGLQPVTLPNIDARNVDMSLDGQRLVYTRYFPTTFDYGLEIINANGTGAKILSQGQPILRAQMPSLCQTQNRVVFVALAENQQVNLTATELPYQVFTYHIDTGELFRLTNDLSSYTEPSYSPDCTKVAVIKTEISGVPKGADVYIIDTTNPGIQTAITNDLSNFTENSPRWSPDGTQLTYSAYSVNDPNNSDIVVRRADPSSTPLVPIREAANEIHPMFSPDGRYIAYASNRSGFYDIYIFDQSTSQTYQLTNSEDEDYPGMWVP
jgi:Tol biopolymer transport system component